ncbi:hypothetical protein OIU79_015923 [Salix purpurea]|uniref:Uncharacterized protein n=1 Tax=Salix purpurea TaxID=77065 RepID=A0A9Q0PDL5_SALPP|nr:hypothetical protein OIU79_015923 [Salix purpurea]
MTYTHMHGENKQLDDDGLVFYLLSSFYEIF